MDLEERELSTPLATALIEEQFPGLRPVKAVYLDEGVDSKAFEVAGEWLFRFPKRAASERALAVERALLPELGPTLPVAVPSFEHIGVPGPRFPFHFVGYRKLGGTSGLKVAPPAGAIAAVGAQLGELLTRLHAFPVEEARRLGVPETDGSRTAARLRDDARLHLNVARRYVPKMLVDRCAVLLESAAAGAISPLAPRLVHNDLSQEHVLLAQPGWDRVSGVVDWGDVEIGDPTIDFAGLFHWLGEGLVREVLASYGGERDAGLVERARFTAACLGLINIGYGLETGRTEYAAAGRRALENATQAGGGR